MGRLTEQLIFPFLTEENNPKTIGIFVGGFKPPTKGHFHTVKKILETYPTIEELDIVVGTKERGNITQEQAIIIWGIYKKYLSPKVKILSTPLPPVKYVFKYAQENYDQTIYWFLGAREGKEDDLTDIANRTKNLNKYQNVNYKVITTEDPEISGTNARIALYKGLDEFKRFLPEEISEEDKEEIYGLLQDQVISKENLLENATYTSHIDIKSKIKDLILYMLKKGENILPLPNIIFKHGDGENAKDFFGKTAYYDPETMNLYLYTEGRHPKDIVRSFAHELIHHKQNLENRIGNTQTTNTNEDGDLVDLEREAFLDGNMNFRNWTDSITEEKKKDPFGLNQYAKELAQRLEEATNTEGDAAYRQEINEKRSKYRSITRNVVTDIIKEFKEYLSTTPRKKTRDVFHFSNSYIDNRSGLEFDITVRITNKPTYDKLEYNGFAYGGDEEDEDETDFITFDLKFPFSKINNYWEELYFVLIDLVRHELEHLTQKGFKNTKPGKSNIFDKEDIDISDPYEYVTSSRETPAQLQGLAIKAKKMRKPLIDVINAYFDDIEVSPEERKKILNSWRKSAKKIGGIPLFEQKKQYKLYVDLDGVLADFDKQFFKFSKGIPKKEFEKKYGVDKFWDVIEKNGIDFWANMDWMEDGKELWQYVKKYNPKILSSPGKSHQAIPGKQTWVERETPSTDLILKQADDKKEFSQENSILIDDKKETIDQWIEKGGIGIHHKSTEDTIKKLKKLNL